MGGHAVYPYIDGKGRHTPSIPYELFNLFYNIYNSPARLREHYAFFPCFPGNPSGLQQLIPLIAVRLQHLQVMVVRNSSIFDRLIGPSLTTLRVSPVASTIVD